MANVQYVETRHPMLFRILHELIMVSIILLIITGFYIHRPFIGGAGFLMTVMRGVHFLFAFVLTVSAITRIVTMFAGKNRDWRTFIPNGRDWKILPKVINYYAYIGDEPTLTKRYNPLQMVTYCVAFVLIIFQIVSGIAIFQPDGALKGFNYFLFNNEFEVRIAHFIVNWLFILIMMVHVYLTIRSKCYGIRDMHLLGGEYKETSGKESV